MVTMSPDTAAEPADAQQRGLSDEDKAGYLDELAAFSRHVLEDVQQRARQQQRQTMAAQAFGYWEPPKR